MRPFEKECGLATVNPRKKNDQVRAKLAQQVFRISLIIIYKFYVPNSHIYKDKPKKHAKV